MTLSEDKFTNTNTQICTCITSGMCKPCGEQGAGNPVKCPDKGWDRSQASTTDCLIAPK